MRYKQAQRIDYRQYTYSCAKNHMHSPEMYDVKQANRRPTKQTTCPRQELMRTECSGVVGVQCSGVVGVQCSGVVGMQCCEF